MFCKAGHPGGGGGSKNTVSTGGNVTACRGLMDKLPNPMSCGWIPGSSNTDVCPGQGYSQPAVRLAHQPMTVSYFVSQFGLSTVPSLCTVDSVAQCNAVPADLLHLAVKCNYRHTRAQTTERLVYKLDLQRARA
jgi:hypothetical protein